MEMQQKFDVLDLATKCVTGDSSQFTQDEYLAAVEKNYDRFTRLLLLPLQKADEGMTRSGQTSGDS